MQATCMPVDMTKMHYLFASDYRLYIALILMLKKVCTCVRNSLYMCVVDLDIGDRIFSKLYDVFKNHCNLSAHFFNLLNESWINR